MRIIVVIAMLLCSPAVAAGHAPSAPERDPVRLPRGLTCGDIRHLVTQWGEAMVAAIARSRGATDTHVAEVRRMCVDRK